MVEQPMLPGFDEIDSAPLPMPPTPAEEYGAQQLLLRLLKAHAEARNPAPLEWGPEKSRALIRYLERIEAAMVVAGEMVRRMEERQVA